jgi:predicted O-methyltransferase YrrM
MECPTCGLTSIPDPADPDSKRIFHRVYREGDSTIPDEQLPEGYFYPGDILAYRQMVAEVPERGRMVELGCYKGRSLCSVAEQVKSRGILVEAVDTWHYELGAIGEFKRNIDAFGLTHLVSPAHMRSLDAAKLFGGQTFNLVFIDTPHDYASVIADLRAWLPLVKPGGIIAGHDYCPQWPGVAKALDEVFGQVDLRARVNETDYCVCWMNRVGLNATADKSGAEIMEQIDGPNMRWKASGRV